MSRPLVLILLTAILDVTGLGLIVPVAPFYATAFGAGALEVGLMFTAFAAAQFLSTPVLGALSDRYGRRPILIGSIFGEAVGYVMMGLANSLGLLYLARAETGATAGNIGAALAYVADITRREERTRTMGLLGAAIGVGFLIGPAMSGVLSQIDIRAPAFGAAGLVLLNALFVATMLPESLPPERRSTLPLRGQLNPLTILLTLFGRPSLRGPLIATFLLSFAFAGTQTNLAVFLKDRFGFGPAEVAQLFVALALAGIFTQGVALRVLSARFSDASLLMMGALLTTSAYVLIGSAQQPLVLWPAMVLWSGGNALWRSPLTSLLTKLVGPDEQGLANGGSQATAALAAVCGPIGAGLAYDYLGAPAPYVSGALVVILAGVAIAAHQPSRISSQSPPVLPAG